MLVSKLFLALFNKVLSGIKSCLACFNATVASFTLAIACAISPDVASSFSITFCASLLTCSASAFFAL